MITCTRRIHFCSGHRVYGHESKCNHLHGHNYVAFFQAEAPNLDDMGRVIDFGVLKELIGGWIDENWDHVMILNVHDPVSDLYLEGGPLHGQEFYTMEGNPTAERMARYLLGVICPVVLADTVVKVIKVTVWETENCFAEATL